MQSARHTMEKRTSHHAHMRIQPVVKYRAIYHVCCWTFVAGSCRMKSNLDVKFGSGSAGMMDRRVRCGAGGSRFTVWLGAKQGARAGWRLRVPPVHPQRPEQMCRFCPDCAVCRKCLTRAKSPTAEQNTPISVLRRLRCDQFSFPIIRLRVTPLSALRLFAR